MNNYLYDSTSIAKELKVPYNEILYFINQAPKKFKKENFNIIEKNDIPVEIKISEIGRIFILLNVKSEPANKIKKDLIKKLEESNPAVASMIKRGLWRLK